MGWCEPLRPSTGGVTCLRRTLTTTEVAHSIRIIASKLERCWIYGGAPAFLKLGRSSCQRIEDLDALSASSAIS